MNRQIVLIIANGETPSRQLLNKLVSESDLIIAADGGANICHQYKLTPDYIIGDMDSITNAAQEFFSGCEFIYRPSQEFSDLQKAIIFAKKFRPDKILVAGVTGKRFDHIIANLYLLQFQYENQPLTFVDDKGRLSILAESAKLKSFKGKTASLFSFNAINGLKIEGFKYIPDKKDYPDGFFSLSNVITSDEAAIHFTKGTLLLYIVHEHN